LNQALELDHSNPGPRTIEAPGAVLLLAVTIGGGNKQWQQTPFVAPGVTTCNRIWIIGTTSYAKHCATNKVLRFRKTERERLEYTKTQAVAQHYTESADTKS
jgi:hypothetical protein